MSDALSEEARIRMECEVMGGHGNVGGNTARFIIALLAERERMTKALREPSTLESVSFREAIRSEMLVGLAADVDRLTRENAALLKVAEADLVVDEAAAVYAYGTSRENGIALDRARQQRRDALDAWKASAR